MLALRSRLESLTNNGQRLLRLAGLAVRLTYQRWGTRNT